MKKEIPPGAIFGAVAVVVLILGFFIYRTAVGDVRSGTSEQGSQLMKVLKSSGGDVSKMNPDEKKIYDQAIKSGYYSPRGTSGGPGSRGPGGAPGLPPGAASSR